MENQELTNKLSAFSVEFNKAKVKERETLWSKALLTSPLFSSSANLLSVELESDSTNAIAQAEQIKGIYDLKEVVFTKNASCIVLDQNDLKDTQYKSFVFYGYQLNTALHFTLLNYMVEVLFSQLNNGSESYSVTIDVDKMIYDLGLDFKSKAFYKEALNTVNSRLAHSSSRFELLDGSVVNDKYIYKYAHDEGKNVFVTVFGDVFVDSIIKDTWKQKINYLEQLVLKEGAARYLYNYINMMIRPVQVKGKTYKVSTISMNTVLKNINSSGSRKTAVESINDAIKYLTGIGFILKCEDERNGGKRVLFKKILVNQDFSLKEYASKVLPKAIESRSRTIDVSPVVMPEVVADSVSEIVTPVESIPVNEALKKIEDDFSLKIGVNPESISPVAQADSESSSVETDWSSWTNDKWDNKPQEEIEVIHDDLEEEFFEPDAFDLENARLFKKYA